MRKLLLTFVLLLWSLSAAAQTSTTSAASDPHWLGTWSTAVVPIAGRYAGDYHLGGPAMTIRQVVHISRGGESLRVRFTNEWGTEPLVIGAAHVAFLSAGSRILDGTDHALSFSGGPGVTIPAGGYVASDPVNGRWASYSDLVISIALPAQTISTPTFHNDAHATTYFSAGDQTAAAQIMSPYAEPPGLSKPDVTAPIQHPDPTEKPIVRSQQTPASTDGRTDTLPRQVSSFFFLKDVEVNRSKKAYAIVCIGDSITDGTGSTTETNRRYPDQFAALLATQRKVPPIAVLNAGIGGNRLLEDGLGQELPDRFARDVLGHEGVRAVILLIGINDIGSHAGVGVTAAELLAAEERVAAMAHAAGLKIYVGTLTPDEGSGYYSAAAEAVRTELNDRLLHSSAFDGAIDFDKATRDPTRPTRLLPKNDSGDHLHPSDKGYAAMASAIQIKELVRDLKR